MKQVGEMNKTHAVILALLCAVVFVGALFLHAKRLYISPDETANAYFSTSFSESGSLSVFEPINLSFDNAIHPRSIVSLDGRLVPGSFIGLPVLYGSVLAVLGTWALAFLTPFIAFLAVFAWYGILRRIFEEKIALVGALLLAIHPGWWYYSARGLMPNVLFTALLIFVAYTLIAQPVTRLIQQNKRLVFFQDLDWVLGGLMLGLALFVRASEGVWLLGSLLLIAFFVRKHIHWQQVLLFGFSCAIALAPMFFLNRVTYGGPLETGYTAQQETTTVVIPPTSEQEDVAMSVSPLLPFGIDLKASAKHVLSYGLGLFWWMGVLSLLGIPLLYPNKSVRKHEKVARKAFFSVAVFVSAWLSIMYGSWTIFDNPDTSTVTIANSYVRYWLPIYALMTPFAAFAVQWISERGRTAYASRVIVLILMVASFALSVRAVYFQPEDGLTAVAATLDRSEQIKMSVLGQTEEDAVIIVDRADKIFFPDRYVMYPLRDETTYDLMPRIEHRTTLYYYGVTFPEQDLIYLNTRKLKERGLQIEHLETFDEESLYRIYSP